MLLYFPYFYYIYSLYIHFADFRISINWIFILNKIRFQVWMALSVQVSFVHIMCLKHIYFTTEINVNMLCYIYASLRAILLCLQALQFIYLCVVYRAKCSADNALRTYIKCILESPTFSHAPRPRIRVYVRTYIV